LQAAYAGLEQEVNKRRAYFAGPPGQASITAGVAWQFTQSMLAEVVAASGHPSLVALSARLERTTEFLKYPPDGPGVVASGT
jgi:hypothetical protein